MNVGELLEDFGYQLDDTVEPYLVGESERMANLNQAQVEACRRMKSIHESQDDTICLINVTSGNNIYRLDPSIISLERVYHVERKKIIHPIKAEILDQCDEGWQTRTGLIENYVLGMDSIRTLRLFRIPTSNQTLRLTVVREPVKLEDPSDIPEIEARYHKYLVHWMLYKAYSKKDSDVFDLELAQFHLNAFEKQFGKEDDSSADEEEFNARHANYFNDGRY